jgi:hypothetical protein
MNLNTHKGQLTAPTVTEISNAIHEKDLSSNTPVKHYTFSLLSPDSQRKEIKAILTNPRWRRREKPKNSNERGPLSERESESSLRASEAPPAILGPSGAARRLPGLKNQIFLKLALLISELLLGRPWASPALP